MVYRLTERRGAFQRGARLEREGDALVVYYQGKDWQIREQVEDLTAGIRRCLQWLEGGFSRVQEQFLDRKETEGEIYSGTSKQKISPVFRLLRPGEVALALEQKEVPGVLSAAESRQLFNSLPVVRVTNVLRTDSHGLWYAVEYQGKYLGNDKGYAMLPPGSLVRLLPGGKAQLVRRPTRLGRCTARAGIFQRVQSRMEYEEFKQYILMRDNDKKEVKPEPAEGEVFDWCCGLDFKLAEPVSAASLCKLLAVRMTGGWAGELPPALGEVIKHNHALQQEARQWNIRAGEEAFSVFTERQWQDWLMPHLAGATTPETIPDLVALRLPPLDPETMELVRMINPPTIPLLGSDWAVEYHRKDQHGGSLPPEVILEGPDMEAPSFAWQHLPDEGVRLPGTDRLVCVRVKVAGTSYASTDVPSLQKELADHLNGRQWHEWKERPAIAVPSPADPEAQVPGIATVQYGTCVVTGQPLLAYGTVRLDRFARGSEPTFESVWLQSKAEAEKAAAEAEAKLAEIKAACARRAARIPAEQVQEELRALYDSIPYDLHDLRESLRGFVLGSLFGSAEELAEWTAEARRKLGWAKAELTTAQAEEPIVEAILKRLGSRGSRETAWTAIAFGKEALRLAGSRERAIQVITHETAPPATGFLGGRRPFKTACPGLKRPNRARWFSALAPSQDPASTRFYGGRSSGWSGRKKLRAVRRKSPLLIPRWPRSVTNGAPAKNKRPLPAAGEEDSERPIATPNGAWSSSILQNSSLRKADLRRNQKLLGGILKHSGREEGSHRTASSPPTLSEFIK